MLKLGLYELVMFSTCNELICGSVYLENIVYILSMYISLENPSRN